MQHKPRAREVHHGIDRRGFTVCGSALLAACTTLKGGHLDRSSMPAGIAPIAHSLTAPTRLGTCAYQSDGRVLSALNADQRFAMCSLFKVPLAAAILSRVGRGELSLGDQVNFGQADLLEYAPVVSAHVRTGRLSVAELCAAAVEVSDNSAANLLLPLIGGPSGLTAFMRRCGDRVSRLDRYEPELNTNLPNDDRDTTTPEAFAALLRSLLAGPILSAPLRQRLIAWMVGSKTGKNRIRAGLPAGWPVGTKSGTGENGAVNDCAIFWPPGSHPVLLVTLTSEGPAGSVEREAAQADIARRTAEIVTGGPRHKLGHSLSTS